jgi:hypothetical protein
VSLDLSGVRAAGADEREQVAKALDARAMAGYLEVAFPSAPTAPRAACRVVDAKYEPGARCTILYQLGDRLVLGTLRWDRDVKVDLGRRIEELGMIAYEFPNDPSIAGLAPCMEPGAMDRVLAEILSECCEETVPLRTRVTPLRYRPGRRCTLRVDARLRDVGTGELRARTLYAKLYHDAGKAASVFAEMQGLHADRSLRSSGCTVAEPIAFVPDLGLILQEPLQGVPLDELLRGRPAASAGDASILVRAAEALAALHAAEVRSERARPVPAALERMAGWARALEASDGAVGGALSQVTHALIGSLSMLTEWGAERTLVHGDCKPSQFLIDGTDVGLLDFDHCGMADPASDVGNFMATLRQHALRHELKPRAVRVAPGWGDRLRGLEEVFLEAYPASAGTRDKTQRRARWYEAAALSRKAYRSWQRSSRSPLPGALLQEARICLSSVLTAHSYRGEQQTGADRMNQEPSWRR